MTFRDTLKRWTSVWVRDEMIPVDAREEISADGARTVLREDHDEGADESPQP